MAGEERKITVDGVDYKVDNLTENARIQIMNLRFVAERLQQLSNELAVANTARVGYQDAVKREVAKIQNK